MKSEVNTDKATTSIHDIEIPDVQNSASEHGLVVDKVGIKSLRHPIKFSDKSGKTQHTVAELNMYVNLPKHIKGTHMSRFVEILEQKNPVFSVKNLSKIMLLMQESLNADNAFLEVTFPFFLTKKAPVSQLESLLDYDISLRAKRIKNEDKLTLVVDVPITSLCPCSKEISKYGAHNQRSHVVLTANITQDIWIEDIIRLIELEASCELYGILKRPDEKFVTERAFENPKFVEDIVRDIAKELDCIPQISEYTISSENFESIHNHSAYAMITRKK